MKRIARLTTSVLAMILCLGLLAGCGSQAEAPPAAPEPAAPAPAAPAADPAPAAPAEPDAVELTFWHIWGGGDANEEIVTQVIADWNAANPGVQVKAETHENEAYKTTIATAVSAGTQPDIFSSWGAGFSLPFVNAGRVLNLDSYMDAAGTANRLAGGALDYVTFDGSVYGLTFGKAASGFFVNENLFTDNNIPIPKTWDELISSCDQLSTAGITPIVTSSMDRWVLGMLFEGIVTKTVGAEKVNRALSKEPGAFADPNFLDALNRLGELRDKGFINRDASAITRDEALAFFQAGNAALYYMGIWEVGALDESVSWIPFPAIPGGGGSATEFNGGAIDSVMVSSSTPYPEEAFKFIEYFTENLSREGYQRGSYMPVWTTAVVDESQLSPTFVKIAHTTADATGFVLWWDTFLSGEDVSTYQYALENFYNGIITAEQAHAEFMSIAP